MDLDKLRKKTIAVLAGGQTGEREVSLRSGQGILLALQSQGLKAVLVDPEPDLIGQLHKLKAEVAFNALHGGPGEDGTIQAVLEYADIPYTGSGVLASALTMNKVQTKRVVGTVGLRNPEYLYFRAPYGSWMVERVLAEVSLPAVTKPNAEGSSLGVTICRDETTLAAEAEKLLHQYGDIIVDRYIQGTELTVGVLGCGSEARPMPVLELLPKKEFYDYEAKYTKGLTDLICPAMITQEAALAAQRMAMVAHEALGCHGLSRCDMHLDCKGDLWFHEVNSSPGLTETSDVPREAEAMGMSYEELALAILQSAFCPRRR